MALRFLWLMALAFALVATVTFASAAGEDDEAAMAAEREYVTDPSTGKQVLKPAYGGTLNVITWNYPLDHGDTWLSHGAGMMVGPALDKIGYADWAIDRSINQLHGFMLPEHVAGHLAESWENPDPLTYIYHFRDDVFFHDKPPVNGRQFTAEDMAANYRRLKGLGEFADKGPSALTFTTGAIPFESVTATDKLTMEIKLSQAFPTTHFTMFQDCLVRAYPPETFDMLDDPGNVIGTGPFIIDEYVSGVSMTLDKNPNYWKDDEKFPGNRQPYVDRLVLLMTADEATRVAALRSRQGDITQIGVAQINGIDTLADLKERNPELSLWPLVARSTYVLR